MCGPSDKRVKLASTVEEQQPDLPCPQYSGRQSPPSICRHALFFNSIQYSLSPVRCARSSNVCVCVYKGLPARAYKGDRPVATPVAVVEEFRSSIQLRVLTATHVRRARSSRADLDSRAGRDTVRVGRLFGIDFLPELGASDCTLAWQQRKFSVACSQ